MKIYKLILDKRTQYIYNEYIGRCLRRKLQKGNIIIKKMKLYDPDLKKMRKQKVDVQIKGINDRIVEIEVI